MKLYIKYRLRSYKSAWKKIRNLFYLPEWIWQNAIYWKQNPIHFYYKLIENKCPYDITWNIIQIEQRENRFIYICVVIHFIQFFVVIAIAIVVFVVDALVWFSSVTLNYPAICSRTQRFHLMNSQTIDYSTAISTCEYVAIEISIAYTHRTIERTMRIQFAIERTAPRANARIRNVTNLSFTYKT